MEDQELDAEDLDLLKHGPMQWLGKHVHLNGATYVIGEPIGQGATSFILKLINKRSGLSLHIIKIYRNQEWAPVAVRTSFQKVGILFSAGVKDLTPWLINVQLSGGVAQVQKQIGLPEAEESPTFKLTEQAMRAWELRRRRRVIALCEQILNINPYHTIALNLLASAKMELRQSQAAMELVNHVVSIEPNNPIYWENYVRFADATNEPQLAMSAYSNLKRIFPYFTDLDDRGIVLYLEYGRPSDAAHTLRSIWSRDELRAKWKDTVRAAMKAQKRAAKSVAKARSSLASGDWSDTKRLLEDAYARYDRDPFTELNLGFACMRTENDEDARRFLTRFLQRGPTAYLEAAAANLAFLEIKQGNNEEAVRLLSIVADMLSLGSGPLLELGVSSLPTQLPGAGIWADETGIVYSSPKPVYELIAYAVDRAGGLRAVSPELRDLVAKYEMLP